MVPINTSSSNAPLPNYFCTKQPSSSKTKLILKLIQNFLKSSGFSSQISKASQSGLLSESLPFLKLEGLIWHAVKDLRTRTQKGVGFSEVFSAVQALLSLI